MLAATCCLGAGALRPANIFSDHAVLQQDTTVNIWGFASPGKTVSVTPSWPGATAATAETGKDGRWNAQIATPKASYTPYQITIATPDSSLTLNDILLGEVWLASGQSNMEMPLRGFLDATGGGCPPCHRHRPALPRHQDGHCAQTRRL